MESSPQIYEFHMILSNGRRIKKSIKHIQLIHQHIIQYGLFTIHTITFNFLHSNLSPYMTHNITLHYQSSQNKYYITYYHYYNWLNQLCIISSSQQYADLCALYKLLSTTENLNQSLLPHVII
jgi:hypothetical protein